MMKRHKIIFKLGVVLWAVSLGISPSYAQSLSYDPYAPIHEEPQEAPSKLKQALNNFLTLPLYLVKWPVDEALLTIEKHHLDKKALWLYETIQDKGVTPKVNMVSFSKWGGGADIDAIRLVRLKEELPDAIVKGWIDYTYKVRWRGGGEIGWDRIADTGFHASAIANYENRPNEFFYGIGPNTSPGDGATFSMETTTFKGQAGYSPNPVWDTDVFVAYDNVNISGGRDGGRGQRGDLSTFAFDQTPGIFGDSILSVGIEMVNDTRNQKENSTRGGMRKLALSFHEGLNGSQARYFKYVAELSHYFRLGSDRRVLAIHAYGEHNDEVNDGRVPFHQMAKLGGYGLGSHRLSHPLRGYEYNRFFDESTIFFNIEYRYTIWEYREFKVDTVFFWDEGQVFGEFGKMQLSDFRESYGLGFRLSLANITLFTAEMAHGDEGTNFYFKTSTPF